MITSKNRQSLYIPSLVIEKPLSDSIAAEINQGVLKQLWDLVIADVVQVPIFDNQVDEIMFKMGYDIKPKYNT